MSNFNDNGLKYVRHKISANNSLVAVFENILIFSAEYVILTQILNSWAYIGYKKKYFSPEKKLNSFAQTS